jgi:serine/threonine protein phosphatase PrpC
MNKILRQIITAASDLHERGIVHRDIKPSNILCSTPDNDKNSFSNVNCVLGDLSSAVDAFTLKTLYGENGPSLDEITMEYCPPEIILNLQEASDSSSSSDNSNYNGNSYQKENEKEEENKLISHTLLPSYDSWSIGVVALEMMLGSPHVFTVSQRTQAILTKKLSEKGASSDEISKALLLAALAEYCIFVPEINDWPVREGEPLHEHDLMEPSCTLSEFRNALQQRDSLGIGFSSPSSTALLHLIWNLLQFDPERRITPTEALNHPYFSGDESTAENEGASSNSNNNDASSASSASSSLVPVLPPSLEFKIELEASRNFTCPKCGKVYDNWLACHVHTTSRKHSNFCLYDTSDLPPCLSAHGMLPIDEMSGYCDVKGRRSIIEDYHSIKENADMRYYGVFDGHNGQFAAKFAASELYRLLLNDRNEEEDGETIVSAFETLQSTFRDIGDSSGTTATVAILTSSSLTVANLGDSRAILIRPRTTDNPLDYHKNITDFVKQLTVDHTAENPDEILGIHERGGFVKNGDLAVSRSIGDIKYDSVLSREPHVAVLKREEYEGGSLLVLATDGLWDVMSNEEVAIMIWEEQAKATERERNGSSQTSLHMKRKGGNHQDENKNGGLVQAMARKLTLEAYVRGSTDNIGVNVIVL